MARRFRFAGLRPPAYAPRVDVVRTPLWQRSTFNRAGAPDNYPIYDVEGDPPFGGGAVTLSTPAVTKSFMHFRNPGTMYLSQAVDTSMAWVADKYFAFKCYFELDSTTGRIVLFSQRSSLDNGGPFVEVRDGYLAAGWYDTDLKKEVFVRTSAPVIEPGYVYYLYYRKWFPRGGLNAGFNAFYTPAGSNWANSVHQGGTGGGITAKYCYDSFVWRRFPRTAPAGGYNDYTGYDAKSFIKPSGAAYNFYTNNSSPRACVSATISDSSFLTGPYPASGDYGATGVVLSEVGLDQATTAGDIVAINGGANLTFLLDHVGMLLQIYDDRAGSTILGDAYRIIEFIDAQHVRVVAKDGSAPAFAFASGVQKVSVFMGVSLVKSDGYDQSKHPDSDQYPIEAFGSSLASNPLNGVQQFNGRAWSWAWGVFAYDGATTDGGSNKVGRPNIFEDCTSALGAGTRISSASEVGTDVFGLQGSTNPLDGRLPCSGVPAGELEVDNTYARVAVNTTPYYPIVWAAPVGSATAPSSTQPNALLEVALDTSSTSAAKPTWGAARGVTAGTRLLRVSFYDLDNNVESAPGDLVQVRVQPEDTSNPSAAVSLVLSGLPPPVDRGVRVARRIRLSAANGTDLFLAAQIDNASAYSAEILIDDVAMQRVGVAIDAEEIVSSFGAPPRGKYVAFAGSRLVIGALDGQEDGFAFSKAFSPSVFPVGNVYAVDTGHSGITGLCELSKALVVFKRDAVMPYVFNQQEQPELQRAIRGDGCIAHSTIASLEDRVYYATDRGIAVLLSDWSPFFIGWRVRGTTDSLDPNRLHLAHGGINRSRSQYLLAAVNSAGDHLRIGAEFQHPMAGEDFTRTELMEGHRFALYSDPSCVSLASVSPAGGGRPVLVGGTEEGFVVWLDRSDVLHCLSEPGIDTLELEGDLGAPQREGFERGELESFWETREFNFESPEINKRACLLDLSRVAGSGALEVALYRNQEATPTGTKPIDNSLAFSTVELADTLQEARSIRLRFSNPNPTAFELLDLTVRYEEEDSR